MQQSHMRFEPLNFTPHPGTFLCSLPRQQNYDRHKPHLFRHILQGAGFADAAQRFLGRCPVLDVTDLVDEVSKNELRRLAGELGILGQVAQQLQFYLQHLQKKGKKTQIVYK